MRGRPTRRMTVSISLEPELLRALDDIATSEDMTFSRVAERLLLAGLEARRTADTPQSIGRFSAA